VNGNDIDDNKYWAQQEQQTCELVKSLPPLFKKSVLQNVRAYLESLSPEDKSAWGNFIGKNPILRRVIYYVFSAVEDTTNRFQMVLNMGGEKFIRDIEYIYFSLEQPEIQENDTLCLFLKQMKESWLRIMIADTFKIEGSKEDIIELRSKAIVREEGKLILNLPGSRMEITRDRQNVYVYEDRSDTAHFFTVDDLLVRQFQEYNETTLRWEVLNDPLQVYVYDRSGNLLKPPPGYHNPFFFSLRKRYDKLIKWEQKKWYSSLEKDEIEDAFEQFVLTTESGNPRYIKRGMVWKLMDISKRNKRKVRLVVYDETMTDPETETKNAEELLMIKERALEKSEILALIRQDPRLSAILNQQSRRSEADQKYFIRKRYELIKKVRKPKKK